MADQSLQCAVQNNFKNLGERLCPLLQKCISNCQGAFSSGKRLSDNIIIAKELLHMMSANGRKKKYCAVKLDIRKAYDNLSWPFLEVCLQQYGFSDVVVHRIMTCVKSVVYTVAVNGHRTDRIFPACDIRQGD